MVCNVSTFDTDYEQVRGHCWEQLETQRQKLTKGTKGWFEGLRVDGSIQLMLCCIVEK